MDPLTNSDARGNLSPPTHPEEPAADGWSSPTEDVAQKPAETGDPFDVVRAKIPDDLFDKYEIYSYRNAAVILSETRRAEFTEILEALRRFQITTQIIRTAGGNES